MPIDETKLKVGDRVNITIKIPNVALLQKTATVLSSAKDGFNGSPYVYLDSPILNAGTSADSSYRVGAAHKAYDAIQKLGLPNTSNVWHESNGDTVWEELLPSKQSIDPNSLKVGDRVRLAISICDGTTVSRTGTVLGGDHYNRRIVFLDDDFASSGDGWSSFPISHISSLESSKETWSSIKDFGFDPQKPHLWLLDLTNTTVEEVLPSAKPIDVDQDTLQIGDDIEIEIDRDGEITRCIATVVATAADERLRFKNDSEAGVILHKEIHHDESPSFVPLKHWEDQAKSLHLPIEHRLGWRLYKTGRNATKVIRKIGKRKKEEFTSCTNSSELVDGTRIEFCYFSSGVRIGRGTILGPVGSRVVACDDDHNVKTSGLSQGEIDTAMRSASKWGMNVSKSNLLSFGSAYNHRLLTTTSLPKEESITVKEAVAAISKSLESQSCERIVEVSHNALKVVMEQIAILEADKATLASNLDEASKTVDSLSAAIKAIDQKPTVAEIETNQPDSNASKVMIALGAGLGALLTAVMKPDPILSTRVNEIETSLDTPSLESTMTAT